MVAHFGIVLPSFYSYLNVSHRLLKANARAEQLHLCLMDASIPFSRTSGNATLWDIVIPSGDGP